MACVVLHGVPLRGQLIFDVLQVGTQIGRTQTPLDRHASLFFFSCSAVNEGDQLSRPPQ